VRETGYSEEEKYMGAMQRVAGWLAVPVGIAGLAVSLTVSAGPNEDKDAFQKYFLIRFECVRLAEFVNGIYAIDKKRREEWEQMEEFPQYELDIDAGEELFHKKFANGKGYVDCFPGYEKGIKQNYPYFDKELGEVVTLEFDINRCRKKHGEKPLKYKRGKIAALGAYLSYLSRGKVTNVVVPDDPRALAAYEDGKKFYYSKRGQLNFSCASCHVIGGGLNIRADLLSPALGQTSHFPVYRKKWGGLGTMHRRYGGCNKQVRARPFKAQSNIYRNLEYFHTYMSNGIPINGPGGRQ